MIGLLVEGNPLEDDPFNPQIRMSHNPIPVSKHDQPPEDPFGKKKRRLARIFLTCGTVIILFFATLFIWPGVLAYLFDFDSLLPANSDGPFAWFSIGLYILCIIILIAVVASFIGFLPIVAAFFIVGIGIPSVVGGIGMLRGKKWAFRLIVFSSFFYLLVFPLGTALGIWTMITYRKSKRVMQARVMEYAAPV